MKKIKIISCTQKSLTSPGNLPLILQSYEFLKDVADINIIYENNRGLPSVYNQELLDVKNREYEWLVFAHDDVFIDDMRIADKLHSAYDRYGYSIVGLAGCKSPTIIDKNLWHWMSPRENWRGAVSHYSGHKDQQAVTCFGPSPDSVIIIDGLFVAVHMPSVRKTPWKFNENYNFHHYDIASCIDANRRKLRVGVYPIHVLHASPGLMSLEDPIWVASNARFIKEYKPK